MSSPKEQRHRVKKGGVRDRDGTRARVEQQRVERRAGEQRLSQVQVQRRSVEEGVLVVVQGSDNERILREVLAISKALLAAVYRCGQGKVKQAEPRVWEEERVRIGTGYRVKQLSEKNPGLLQFDLGYGHRRRHERPRGMGVEVSKAGRTIRWEGDGARQKVKQEVSALERRRPRSEYTGCGRTRKSRVGKKKLKPTKVRV